LSALTRTTRSSPGTATGIGWPGCTPTSPTAAGSRRSGTRTATRPGCSTTSIPARDQVAWVIDRLRRDPASRSAAITTFQPRTDTAYLPCVSLLDFWLPGGAVELIVYAHSIDFGAKGYGNLAELASLQHLVAGQLGRPAGRLVMIIKSAHVYETERGYVLGVLADEDAGRSR
jgi:thymidylate synthase